MVDSTPYIFFSKTDTNMNNNRKTLKRIFGILPSLGSGGAERQLIILLEQLALRGYDVTFVTYVKSHDSYQVPSCIKRKYIHGGNKIIDRLNLARFMWSINNDDIVIAFLSVNFRDVVLPVLLFDRSIIAGERNLTRNQNFTRRLVFQLERKAKAIVSNNYAQKKWMQINTPWLSNKTFVITNYTDTDKFYPAANLLNDEDMLIIGVLARFSPQKNCIRFAQAVNKAVSEGCKNFRVIWYGNNKTMRGEVNHEYVKFKDYIKEHHLENYIEIRSFTNKVFEVNNYCDVMCLPSLFEGFSNSLSESICCGKPIIASNISDNPIIVKDGVNGFLFNPTDVDDMTKAIKKMLDLSDKERIEMGHKSRSHAITLFNLDKFTNDYVDIIEKL